MIADRSRTIPAMHMDATNGFQHVASNNYWSSTTVASNSSYAWAVSFNDGNDGWGDKTYGLFVRCVRDGQIVPSETFLIPTVMYLLQ